jgi:hypothetical protein
MSEWHNIPGLPGEWRTGRAATQAARTNMKAKATAAIEAADQGTVKILGPMLRSARAYAILRAGTAPAEPDEVTIGLTDRW